MTQRKAELVSELHLARTRIKTGLHDTAQSLNVVEHMKHSITENKIGWLTGAALAGTVFAWWMRRPRTVKVLPEPSSLTLPATTVKIPQKGYIGLVVSLAAFAFNLSKPLLSALITRKIARMAARVNRK